MLLEAATGAVLLEAAAGSRAVLVEAAAWAVSSETAADGGGSAVEAPAAGTTSILLPSASQVMEVTDFPLTSVAPKRWPVKAESALEAGSCKNQNYSN